MKQVLRGHPRVSAALTCALAVAALAAVGTSDLWVPAPAGAALQLPTYSVAPSSMTLACAPGVEDPYDSGASVADGTQWSSRGQVTTGVTPFLTVSAAEGDGSGTVPSAVTVAGQGGGELRGLALLPCTAPTSDQWVAAGSTAVGEDLLLVLSNPSAVPARVTVDSYGATGRSQDAPQSVTVPAGEVAVLVPATWFPDEDHPVFHVTADGPGVSAWVQSSGLDGEVPTGTSGVPATSAGTDLVLPGVSAGTGATVRLLVPGDRGATVSLGVSGKSGTSALAGADDIEVDPGVPLDVDLSGIPGEDVSLVVTSDQPVVAMADIGGTGEEWPDSDQKWGSRTLVVPGTPVTALDLPGSGDVVDAVEGQLGAAVLRATSVQTESGGGDSHIRLLLSAPDGPAATVTVGGKPVEVPGGATVSVDLPARAAHLGADRAVRAAIVVTATTPTGAQTAVWPLGTTGVNALDVPVDLRP